MQKIPLEKLEQKTNGFVRLLTIFGNAKRREDAVEFERPVTVHDVLTEAWGSDFGSAIEKWMP